MSAASKRYADGQQKDPAWRRLMGFKVGRKKFTPRPSSHAAARLKNRTKMITHPAHLPAPPQSVGQVWRLAFFAAVLALIGLGLCAIALGASTVNADPPSAASGCVPPAANWATLVACRTATARGGETATPMPTPTRLVTDTPVRSTERTPLVQVVTQTPAATPYPLLVLSDGSPYVCRDESTPLPPLVLLPGGRWLACVPVREALVSPTRITP